MSAENVIKLADRLAGELGAEMAQMDLKSPPDDESVERHASIFRRSIEHFSSKAAAARRAWKLEAKALAAERRQEEERHRAALAALDERELEMHARGKERVDAAELLLESYTEALMKAETAL